jgi:hypothetical protein
MFRLCISHPLHVTEECSIVCWLSSMHVPRDLYSNSNVHVDHLSTYSFIQASPVKSPDLTGS